MIAVVASGDVQVGYAGSSPLASAAARVLGIVVIAAIAFLLELAIRIFERALVPWTGKS